MQVLTISEPSFRYDENDYGTDQFNRWSVFACEEPKLFPLVVGIDRHFHSYI